MAKYTVGIFALVSFALVSFALASFRPRVQFPLIPESKHRKKCVSTFQSLGLVHEAYDLSEVVSVYNVRCCGIISVEEFGS